MLLLYRNMEGTYFGKDPQHINNGTCMVKINVTDEDCHRVKQYKLSSLKCKPICREYMFHEYN